MHLLRPAVPDLDEEPAQTVLLTTLPGSPTGTRNRTAADANDVNPSADAVPNGEPRLNAVPNGVHTVNGVQRCPHCHHELAVIAVLVPPAAANVRLSEVTMPNPP
jgi:hypothetical protein